MIDVIHCPGCGERLTIWGCVSRGCKYGPGTGYTLPPPPKFTDAPDPFPDLCPTCGQKKPSPPPPTG